MPSVIHCRECGERISRGKHCPDCVDVLRMRRHYRSWANGEGLDGCVDIETHWQAFRLGVAYGRNHNGNPPMFGVQEVSSEGK